MSKVLSDVDIHDAIVASYTNWVSKLIKYGEDRYESNFHSSDPVYWVLHTMGLLPLTENQYADYQGPESLSKKPLVIDEDDNVWKYVYDKFENELSIKRLREAAANLARHPEVDVWEYACDYVLVPLIDQCLTQSWGTDAETNCGWEDIDDAAFNLRLKIEEAQGE